MNPRTRRWAVVWPLTLAAVVAAATGGCVRPAPPPPLKPPALSISLTHFAGTAVSGPRPAAAAAASATPALLVAVDVVAVERFPEGADGLVPVGAGARLLLSTRDAQPLLSTSRLTAGARWAGGADAAALDAAVRAGQYGRTAPVSSHRTAIPKGVTADLHAANPGAPADAPEVDLYLHHVAAAGPNASPDASGLLELTLGLQDFAAATGPAEQEPAMNVPAEPKSAPRSKRSRTRGRTAPETQPASPVPALPAAALSRELAVMPPLQPGPPGGDAIVGLFVFRPTFAGDHKAIVATVRAAPAADDPETQKLLVATLGDVRLRGDAALGRGGNVAPSTQPGRWPGYDAALALLDRPDTRRRAMAYLASQTGARLCEDLALVADDASLQQLAAEARAGAAAAQPPYAGHALGWVLDRTCLAWSARLSGEDRLPPEVAAVLGTYAGEAGRRAASLEEMLRAADSRAALEARVASENLIYLEDSSPSARVRAFDWLAARGRAPAGYDPLGPPRARREALERALEAAAAGTAPSATPAPAPAATSPAASR